MLNSLTVFVNTIFAWICVFFGLILGVLIVLARFVFAFILLIGALAFMPFVFIVDFVMRLLGKKS